jgi:hypothetical protein
MVASLFVNSTEFALYSMVLIIIFFLGSYFLRFCNRILVKADNREIIAYHLFKAADFLKRNRVEQNENSRRGFIKNSLKHLEKFNDLLRSMLRQTKLEMPLSLPNFEHLSALRKNIMTRIYPRIQEESITEILFSLASIFSLEKKYEQIAEINIMLEGTLNPAKPFSKVTLVSSLTKPIKSSLTAVAFLSLVGVIIATFIAVILLRFPAVGLTVDWAYISENSAIIVVGILAGWGALIVLFKPKGEK